MADLKSLLAPLGPLDRLTQEQEVELAREGTPEAHWKLVKSLLPWTITYIRRLKRPDLADSLLQEAIATSLAQAQTFVPENGRFYSHARPAIHDAFRRELAGQVTLGDAAEAVLDTRPPESNLVERFLTTLSERDAKIVELKLSGETNDVIARICGYSADTVRRSLSASGEHFERFKERQ